MPEQDEIIRKRVTLHPIKEDGSPDLEVNLYPKTFLDGIVDRDGNEVNLATKADLNTAIWDIDAQLDNIEEQIASIETGDVTHEELEEAIAEAISDKVTEKDLDTAFSTIIAEDWVANTDYKKHTIVIYNGALYECTHENSDEEFNEENWWQRDVGSILKEKQTKLKNAQGDNSIILNDRGDYTSIKVNPDSFQEQLVSGENIKTINGQSLLGRGNILIEGGSGGTSTVLYRHSIPLTIDAEAPYNSITFTFLSKHEGSFGSNINLTALLRNILNTGDNDTLINPLAVVQGYPPLIICGFSHDFNHEEYHINTRDWDLTALNSDNLSITDTVTPYIQAQGGGGSGSLAGGTGIILETSQNITSISLDQEYVYSMIEDVINGAINDTYGSGGDR